MTPLGAHTAHEPGFSKIERWYLRVFGSPEPSLRIRTAHVLRAIDAIRPMRVLDAGAGAGYTAIALAARSPEAEVTALDVDAPAVEHGNALAAAAGVRNVTFVCRDALAYEPERSFDAVVCVDSLEYIADDDAFLRRVRSWLAPGGLFVLHCRATPTAYRTPAFRQASFDRDGRLRSGYSIERLHELFEGAGLQPQTVRRTLTAPAELAYEIADPELGVVRGRVSRALAAPPLLLVAQLDRLGVGRGAGILAVARRP